MDENTENTENTDEADFFAFLAAREAALGAAVGCFITDNVPRAQLESIARRSADKTIAFAARIALYQRDGVTIP